MNDPTTGAQVRRSSVPPLIVTQDNAFWFEGVRQGKLLIQRCGDCGALRQPPGPVCPDCRSFHWDTIESSRRGTLHSYTVVHRPQDSAFTYPLAVGLLDLDEGTRIVADIGGTDPAELTIGMAMEVVFTEHAHGEVLPRLRPVSPTFQEGRTP
ncbi:Zn-ribbon domain-containing OB-fold protein [Actinomadura rudentiformis]|uniref:Zn-ribbon domain-containing OB-fold protein n=1 Tax=Actinomadura rudentiformis TaxID=359158 RepID=A0A6H9YNS2_9ACTN|nr:Zn-ribbon domain-containing OB-fold protein [Actinomadura rudentiformis]KAB2341550.1 Zn-ribbon domain-containing OB-fold protein [Actinomadura rudentiformis]